MGLYNSRPTGQSCSAMRRRTHRRCGTGRWRSDLLTFYRDTLGLPVEHQHDGFVQFATDGTKLFGYAAKDAPPLRDRTVEIRSADVLSRHSRATRGAPARWVCTIRDRRDKVVRPCGEGRTAVAGQDGGDPIC